MKKIGIIGGGLAPYFNEAMANQMRLLSKKLKADVITCSDIGWLPFKKMGQYLIVNSRFIFRKTPILSFINGVILYAIVKLYEKKFDTIIIPGGIESEFLRYLNPEKCIPIVTSIPFINESVQNKIKELAPKLKRIIVQSKKTRNQLMDMGVEPDKIVLMYPLIDLSKFKYSEPPPLDEFRILFASSPNLEVPGEDNFRDKGLPLLLEAFKEFAGDNSAKLYIVWRGKYNEQLYKKISELNLEKDVKVITGIVNMPEMYANVHITVIPFLNLWRSPEIPLSAVESLACGRPVVATDVGEIAELIENYKCGCVSKTVEDDFLSALEECKRNYQLYHKNCKKFAGDLFSLNRREFGWIDGLKEPKPNICVITHPFDNIAGETILENFIEILEPVSNEIFVIPENFSKSTKKRIHIITAKGGYETQSILIRISRFILTQLSTSLNLIKIFRKVDIIIFFIGARLYIVPMFLTKLLRKKTIMVGAGCHSKNAKYHYSKGIGKIVPSIFKILEFVNYHFSNQIVVYSEGLIEEYSLETYKNKIYIAHEHFLDFSKFKIKKKLSERNNLVGYIGRLSEEKGVLNFVKAIPEILKKRDDLEFLIGGDGQLRDEIEKYVSENNLNDKVKLVGWILHDELPDYLNELKLVVLPSFTEGLPNVTLEAMACGTPVLATPVGSVPDVIKDEEIGFIMENNSPECIARNVIRALNHPNLERIAENARALVEREFTYERAVERWRGVLENV